MVHLRLNDPNTSRNPYINFITSLDRYPNHADALSILQRLAALFKPIMKAHGLQINSLEEYEPNDEFGGRNWNAGENIEMVLRSKLDHTRFLPFGLICYVFAHELAHNHVSDGMARAGSYADGILMLVRLSPPSPLTAHESCPREAWKAH